MSDPVDQINREAATNLGRQHFQSEQYTIYGDYTYVPIQEDRKQQIVQAFSEIQQMCKPTISQLVRADNVAEIQDRLYRKFSQFEGQLNTCILKSKNVRDSNDCADIFINQMKTDGKQHAISVLKDY